LLLRRIARIGLGRRLIRLRRIVFARRLILWRRFLVFVLIAGVVIYKQMRQLQPNSVYDNADFSPYGHGKSSMADRMKNRSQRP